MLKHNLFIRLLGCLLTLFVITANMQAQDSVNGTKSDEVSIELLMMRAYYAQQDQEDYDKAIDLYLQVLARSNADLTFTSHACYQLGQCYRSKGDEQKAIDYYKKTATEYAEVEKWRQLAMEKLDELGVEPTFAQLAVHGSDIALLPAPWSDGDSFSLDMRLKTGTSLGSLSYAFAIIEKDGRKYWQISGKQVADAGLGGSSTQTTVVKTEFDNCRPIYSSAKNHIGTITANYGEKKVSLQIDNNDPNDISIDGKVYDSEQVLCLLRMLPLAEKYSCKFDMFIAASGYVVECQIRVLASETMAVPAGEFPCYKVAFSYWYDGVKDLEHYVWIEQTGKRNIVKYDAGKAEMVLK